MPDNPTPYSRELLDWPEFVVNSKPYFTEQNVSVNIIYFLAVAHPGILLWVIL